MRGLIALQEAEVKSLVEPQCGYVIPGLSFTPNELLAEIRKDHPGFGLRVQLNQNKFANLWPDELGTGEAIRYLGYSLEVKLPENGFNGVSCARREKCESCGSLQSY